MSALRRWLDTTPVADLALAVMREATGRAEPLEPLRPARPAAMRRASRVAFWSLVGGGGTSTIAALCAHRSAAAGAPPFLFDLDLWAPTLALRAGIEAATIVDALVQPDRERSLVSRWRDVPFVPGAPSLHRAAATDVLALIDRVAGDRAAVLDLGSGAAALDAATLARVDRLCVVVGPGVSQLQALFCSRELVRDARGPIGVVAVRMDPADASLVAQRSGLPLLATIPEDAYLARDDFAARAPTLRAIDRLIAAL